MIVQIKAQPRAAYKGTQVRMQRSITRSDAAQKITCLPSGALRRTWNEPDDG